jgi:SagB-type dehydrogenase family enzyme
VHCIKPDGVPVSWGEFEVLNALASWSAIGELRRRLPHISLTSLRSVLARMRATGTVHSSADEPTIEETGHAAWSEWAPSAAYFHFATKDMAYLDRSESSRRMRTRIEIEGTPPRLKALSGERRRLPAYRRKGPLTSILLQRRSWRRFGSRRVTVQQLSELLGLTFGVQKWMQVDKRLQLPLKTSPSGGACHSLEAYVAVRAVQGVAPGLYHYCPETHALTLVRKGCNGATFQRYLGGQRWTRNADAVVFMTSVFERVRWKYRFPRAYRVVLLEAGHFCQTFCLVATSLRLAPFCTAALADSRIEDDLGIDGVNEAVLYAVGVGTKPRRTSWAPHPDGHRAPLRLPTHLRPSAVREPMATGRTP